MSAVMAKYPIALLFLARGKHQRKIIDRPHHGHTGFGRNSSLGMARQRDMRHIGPLVQRKIKHAQRLAERLMQVLQGRRQLRSTQHGKALGPEPGLVEYQIENQVKRLEWQRNSSGNRLHFFGCHITHEMQGDMPVCWRIAHTACGPQPLIGMGGQLHAYAVIRPKRQKKALAR